jgi:predicted RNase H-like HicB family nuclease
MVEAMSEQRRFEVVYESDEGGAWNASIPSVRGCLTWGRSLGAARRYIREALSTCLEEKIVLKGAARGALEEYFNARRKAAEFQDLAQARAVDAAKVLTKVGHLSLRDAGELLDLSHERVSQVLSKKLESTLRASTSTKATAKKTVTFDRGALLFRSAEPARKKQAKRARGAA